MTVRFFAGEPSGRNTGKIFAESFLGALITSGSAAQSGVMRSKQAPRMIFIMNAIYRDVPLPATRMM